MRFEQLKDENAKPTKDILTDDSGNMIKLQDIVQDVLRDRNAYEANKINTNGLIILFKPPLNIDDSYLLYEPNRNASLPTLQPVALGNEYQSHKKIPAEKTQYGQFWHQLVPMSAADRQEVLDKQAEQRANRRKSGDSPNTN